MIATKTPFQALRIWLKAAAGLMALFFAAGQVSAQTYCAVTGNGDAGITKVVFNTINNSSASNVGYTDFTGQSTTVMHGETHALSVTINATGGFFSSKTNTAVAWIDWNQNGTFEASEAYSLGTHSSGYSGSSTGTTSNSPLNISVPTTALVGTTRMRIRTHEGGALGACGNSTKSEAEDYTINVIPLPVCSGTPNPGNTTVSNVTPCPGASITLDFQNHSIDAGLSYQWQSSTTGIGGPFASNGLGTATSQVTTPSVATWYRIAMTCSGNTGYSTAVLVTPGLSGACYCTPTASTNDATGVTNVTFNTINNSSSGSPAYTDYSGQSTSVDQGGSYPLSVRVNTAGNFTVYVKAWFDWNQNGTFDASEEYNLGSVTNVGDGAPNASPYTILVPITAVPGTTVMRVRASYTTAPSACGNNNYSEAEDYTLNVVIPPPCTGIPYPGYTTVSNATPCPGSSVTLGFDQQVTGAGLSYQWQSSTSGFGGPFADNGLGTTPTQVTLPGVATWYRIAITCSGFTGYSTPVLVTPTLTVSCYCAATGGGNDATGVTDVTFNDISNTSAGDPAYSDYSALSTTVNGGQTYALSVSVNVPNWFSTVRVKAWIDWNQNGVFEGSESYDLGSLASTLGTAAGPSSASPLNITVPLTALGGPTTMRIRAGDGTPGACGNMSSSEAEDYTVNVHVQVPCSGTPYPGNTTSTHVAPCNGSNFTLGVEFPSTDVGLTYQWQSSTTGIGGPFANNGLGTAATQVTNASIHTWYRVVVTCSGNAGPSNPISVTPSANGAACYCEPTANSNNATGIMNVTFNTIDNSSSSNPAYNDYSAMSTIVYAGEIYPLTVTANAPGFAVATTKAWIDWNQNGTFEASESYDLGTVLLGAGVTSNSPANVTVPLNAVGGRTIMRVRTANGGAPSPCGNANNSEAEDYTVFVVPVHNTCATAFPMECGDSFWGKTTGVAHSMPANACPFNGAASTGGQNWWKFTATTNEAVTLSTCGQASFDTRISVFAGAGCNSLSCVSMVDDSPGCAGGTSSVTFNANAGSTYWIAVNGSGTSEGTYQLTVICGAICTPPANDVCSDAAAISFTVVGGTGTSAEYTNSCATVDAPTSISGTMPVQGVWFTFNPGTYRHALITLLDNSQNSQYTASTLDMALFTGVCSGLGAEQPDLALSDAAGTSVHVLTPNTDYRLLVYNTGGSGVSGTFGLMMQNPAHDDAAITAILDPAPGLFCGSSMAPKVTLLNNGDNDLTSVQITYGLSGGVNHTYNWTGNLAYGASMNITLPTVPAEAGMGQTLTISSSLPNGVTDDIATNDSKSIGVDVGGEALIVNIQLDANMDQGLTWDLFNGDYSYYLSGGPYTAGQANTLISEFHCLPTDGGNCYTFHLYDSYGDGLCCANGNGYWELSRPDGRILLRDRFDAAVDGSSSPAYPPAISSYYDHSFCLPPGNAHIATKSCGVFNSTMNSLVYSNTVPGATSYQFEFSNPDAGFIRRIAMPTNSVRYNMMVTSPLTPGMIYFARVRNNAAGAMASAHFGGGCELGMMSTVPCTELISAPTYGHSCGETRSFNTNNSFIYALPVVGATEYQFRISIPGEDYDETFIRSTYILQLKWNASVAPPLVNGSTYNVKVNVKVGTVYSGFCGDLCTITIDNTSGTAQRPAASMVQSTTTATMWPNPVRDGQVNLSINGIENADQQITVNILDLYGKQIFAKEFGNSGERFTTILDLPSDVASGVYLVNITVNGKTTVQRLSIIK